MGYSTRYSEMIKLFAQVVSVTSPTDQQVADFFCGELLSAWRGVSPGLQPPNVWLRQHEAFSYASDVHQIPTPVVAAWLLQDGRIEQRSVSEFLRFYVVQGDMPWVSAQWRPSSEIFGRGTHEFGLAAFAPILGSSSDYYFEWQFGGLHGRGWRYSYAAGVFTCIDSLWMS